MRKRILILSLIVMLILSFWSVAVNAAESSFTTSMTAKNSKVTAGSEVLITVKLSNLNVGENGINSFSAYLSYDTEVFETLTDSSVDGVNSWIPNYTPGTGRVTLHRPTSLKTDEEIMQISLKTKSGLADGTQGEIKLSTIIVNNSIDEFMASPVSTSITIGSQTTSDPVLTIPQNNVAPINITTNSSATPSPIPVNNTVTQPVNNSVIVNNPTSNGIQVVNESKSDIPYTGTDSNALARIIIGFIVIGLVLYIKIERMNKDIK